jgi:DNA-binding MarR family transcriptional regulator
LSAAKPIDSALLESLVGYNARRAYLTIFEHFLLEMAPYQLRPVDFSVMSLVMHNPGITSRQLCAMLGLLPPNLVGMLKALERRTLLERRPHPADGRSHGLHATRQGMALMADAECTAVHLEQTATAGLTPVEIKTLIKLLKKIYLTA